MLNDIITEIPVTVYGNLEKYTDTISKGRCRIFYKGGNRNGTYITDEFAEKLLSSIPYAPVKGIYNGDDYTDHGESRKEGRIYGVVPAEPNLAWESHLDEDGEERIYACVDVLIYTALYNEAYDIIGKSQSMELYPKSIKGDWKILDGRRYYVFEEGSFLGLQVLGDDTEPCFQGAAFFSFYNELKDIVEQIEKYNLNLPNDGGEKMLNYKLSDNAKFNALWSLLNVNYTQENDWLIEYDICEIYDEYAVVKNYSDNIWERVYYKKNDETDSVEITSHERCYIMDVSENEKNALESLHKLNENTYEKIDEKYSEALTSLTEVAEKEATYTKQIDELKQQQEEKNSEFETKIGELNNSVSTLTTERDNANAQLQSAQETVDQLNEQIASLNSFKSDVEKSQKEAVIKKYTALLDANVLESYSKKMDDYTAVALDKELAYELVSTKVEVFSKTPEVPYVPLDDGGNSGLEEILSRYKKN